VVADVAVVVVDVEANPQPVKKRSQLLVLEVIMLPEADGFLVCRFKEDFRSNS
jgi:hypothetical protein